MTTIEWTEKTWNPVTGCTKVSSGCKFCYAERMAKRLKAMGQPNYANGFEVTCHMHMLDVPLKRKKPTMYFVCSMGDLFHEDVPFAFIDRVFDVMRATPQHTYQVLTKRAVTMLNYSWRQGRHGGWPDNVWAGVSVENIAAAHGRVNQLAQIDAKVRFLSCEPLLNTMSDQLVLTGIHWVICGGESGPGARPMDLDWARELRDQCVESKTPYFFKQVGGVNKKKTGRVLDGRTWDQMPGHYAHAESAAPTPSEKHPCPLCNGDGWYTVPYGTVVSPCNACGGDGEVD